MSVTHRKKSKETKRYVAPAKRVEDSLGEARFPPMELSFVHFIIPGTAPNNHNNNNIF